jgi:AraC-like DNA-binding protein
MHQQVHYEIEALPGLRATTRVEIYRRLYRAKDYITALFDQPLTLADMAYVACLSPNHFLRLFKMVFHQTPHQYLINIRLAHVQQLLIESERPVTDICFSVGFESLSSFSWLFKQRFGRSPLAYRRQKK